MQNPLLYIQILFILSAIGAVVFMWITKKTKKQPSIKKRCIAINKELLDQGLTPEQIPEVWHRHLAESEIQTLPKCKCDDVNQCNTWCSAKQRFKQNPPN